MSCERVFVAYDVNRTPVNVVQVGSLKAVFVKLY